MILYIKGADFSSANIGTLNSYVVRKSIGQGATHRIPDSVIKDSAVNWEITLNEGYTFGIYTITMGSTTITPTVNGNVMTISIPKVTGNINVSVATINENVNEELYTFTITPSPGNATVKLTAIGYTQVGNSIAVAAGTNVIWEVSADGYTTQSGTETINSDLNKSVILSQSENGIYPIGQVLDSGTVSTNTTALLPACTTKDILECGGIYEITITPSYNGNCALYLGGKTGSQYCLKQQTGVVANTPFTLTFNVPYLNYFDKEKVELNKVWFRSYQSTECTFTYSIKKTGYNNNPLEGVAIFKDSTISATGQRVYGFEAGCTYDYEITPSYTGTMTIYQAYSNAGVSTGSVENIGAMSIASVTANTPIKGTITILETPSVTEATLGRLPDTLILRSHQSVEVSIQYKFTKK